MAVFRVYVEKKAAFALKAEKLKKELGSFLELPQLEELRIINRYDVEGIDEELFKRAVDEIFSNAVTDDVYFEEPESYRPFARSICPDSLTSAPSPARMHSAHFNEGATDLQICYNLSFRCAYGLRPREN